MTRHIDGRLGGLKFFFLKDPETGDEKFTCAISGKEFASRDEFLAHAEAFEPTAKVIRPLTLREKEGSILEFPKGYTVEGGKGGYYILTDPDGKVVPGPSNGKWQGEDGAILGAHHHRAEQGA